MKQPKLSIIVPVYGVEKFLKKALDSIINQTLKDIEIIIIDDGSPDKCPDIIDKYAKKDKRIIAIHKINEGYGKGCNVGISKAKGEYIAIFEPDDYVANDMYEQLYNRAIETKAEIVRCEYNAVNENGVITPSDKIEIPNKKTFNITEAPMLIRFQPSIWAAIYKRSFLIKNNIRMVEEKGAGLVDTTFKYEVLFASNKISFVHKNLYFYFINEQSSVKKGNLPELEYKRWKEVEIVLKKYPDKTKKIKEYILINKLHTFYFAFNRVKPEHYQKLMRLWSELFKNISIASIDKNDIFTHELKELFKIVKKNNIYKLKFYELKINLLNFTKNNLKRVKRKIKSIL